MSHESIQNQLYDTQDGKCKKCGKKVKKNKFEFDIDHIIPRSQGGSNSYDNMQLLCKVCHAEKTAKERMENRNKKPKTEYMVIRVFTDDVTRLERRKIHHSQPICETLKEVLDRVEQNKSGRLNK